VTPDEILPSGYRLRERLGGGSAATVYRATRGAESVAIKLLHPHLARDPVIGARFLREVTLARTLVHPSIVRVFDLVTWQDTPGLVMELCTGGNLVGWRPGGAQDLVRLILDGAGALALAHGQGIVHRDLKPSNVLRDGTGRFRLCDFGSAGVQDSVSLSTSSLLVSAPYYVAPEVFEGHPADPRSDLYSLGAVVYEAATGRTARTRALPGSGSEADRPDRSALEDVAPRWLAEVVLGLLAPLEDRPPDADTVLRAVQAGHAQRPPALKRCLFCGAGMPAEAPLCLHCGEEVLALHLPDPGQGHYILLGKIADDAATLQSLTELVRAISGNPAYELELMFQNPRLYSRQEQKRKRKLPARLVEDLTETDAQRLLLVLGRIKVKASAYRGRRARPKPGPLVRAVRGQVHIPHAVEEMRTVAAELPERGDPWVRSLASRLFTSVYRLEAMAAQHELGELVRESLRALWRHTERLLDDLVAIRTATSGVNRADLYAEVARAGLAEGGGESARVEALDALHRHEEAERVQTNLMARVLGVCGRLEHVIDDLAPAAGQVTEAAAVRGALEGLEAELRGPR
jgi:serine/threonine-protein kinase